MSGLSLIATRFATELRLAPESSYYGELRRAILEVKQILHRLLPATLHACPPRARAVLVPAADLMVTVTKAVILFSELEEHVIAALDEFGLTFRGTLGGESMIADCEQLVARLESISTIFRTYEEVLRG